MYFIKYEKSGCQKYAVFKVHENQLNFMLSTDNGFQQVYENSSNVIIRLHYKYTSVNKPLFHTTETILEKLNSAYVTSNDCWTISVKEKMLNNNHIVQYFFYSNIYSIKLEDLKKSVDKLLIDELILDDSIYYNSYYNCVINEIPFQTNLSKKRSQPYRLFNGSLTNTIISSCINLKLCILE